MRNVRLKSLSWFAAGILIIGVAAKEYFGSKSTFKPNLGELPRKTSYLGHYSAIKPISGSNLSKSVFVRLSAIKAVVSTPKTVLFALVQGGPITQLTLNGSDMPPNSGRSELPVDLNEGENLFRLEAKDKDGKLAWDEIRVVLDLRAPSIKIQTPQDNAEVHGHWLDVQGIVSDDVGISSVRALGNGIQSQPAYLDNGKFKITHFPIREGLNTMQIEAIDFAGRRETKAFNVIGLPNANGTREQVTINISDRVGQCPHSVEFSLNLSNIEDIDKIEWDFDGDGKVDLTCSDSNPVTHVYDKPGMYYPMVTVVTKKASYTSYGGWAMAPRADGEVIRPFIRTNVGCNEKPSAL